MAIALATAFLGVDKLISHCQTNVPQGTVSYASMHYAMPKQFEPEGYSEMRMPVVPLITINQVTGDTSSYKSGTVDDKYGMQVYLGESPPDTLFVMNGV